MRWTFVVVFAVTGAIGHMSARVESVPANVSSVPRPPADRLEQMEPIEDQVVYVFPTQNSKKLGRKTERRFRPFGNAQENSSQQTGQE